MPRVVTHMMHRPGSAGFCVVLKGVLCVLGIQTLAIVGRFKPKFRQPHMRCCCVVTAAMGHHRSNAAVVDSGMGQPVS